jgi:GNAT superfamily N-acetyltransferase
VITVREATPADVEPIVAVNAAGWRRGYRGIVSEERLANLPLERWRSEISEGLRDPAADSFTLVAEVDGEFAGYCYVAAPGRDPDLPEAAELVAIYVDPERWGAGIGSALIEAAERETAGRGYEEMALWTFEQNEPALRFYRRRGWRPDGRQRVHELAGATAVRLRKRLGRLPRRSEAGKAK